MPASQSVSSETGSKAEASTAFGTGQCRSASLLSPRRKKLFAARIRCVCQTLPNAQPSGRQKYNILLHTLISVKYLNRICNEKQTFQRGKSMKNLPFCPISDKAARRLSAIRSSVSLQSRSPFAAFRFRMFRIRETNTPQSPAPHRLSLWYIPAKY